MKATVTKYTDKRLQVKERKHEGVLGYDIDNNYPDRIRDIVNNSGMGKSCVSLYKKFIFGQGFKDKNLAQLKLNRKGSTDNKLLKALADNYAFYGGFAIHINYNALFEITEINFQPFAHVRRTTPDSDHPDMFAVSKEWGEKRLNKDKIKYIDKYNPDPLVITQQVEKAGGFAEYKGQILYYSDEDEYPLALYDAVLEDMQTDSQTKTFKFRNVTTNFLASHMIVVDKMESGESDIPGEKTREKSNLVEQLEEYQGAEESSKIMVVEKESADQTFELQKIDIQNIDNLYQYTEKSTRDNIRQAFLIPSVLLQTIPGKLGTSQEIVDATKYYNLATSDERQKLEETIKPLIENFQPGSGYDYAIAPKNSIDSNVAIEQFTTQSMSAMVQLLNSSTITSEQKKNILIVLYGFTADKAEQLIGKTNVDIVK